MSLDDWFASLDHPQKDAVGLLRRHILAASPDVTEGIKWNTGSFRTHEWFATFHLRRPTVMLVLHCGTRPDKSARRDVPDPAGLLTWKDATRATMEFRDLAHLEARLDAVDAILRAWIATL